MNSSIWAPIWPAGSASAALDCGFDFGFGSGFDDKFVENVVVVVVDDDRCCYEKSSASVDSFCLAKKDKKKAISKLIASIQFMKNFERKKAIVIAERDMGKSAVIKILLHVYLMNKK